MQGFHEKLALVLKAMSLTRSDVAMRLRVDKSLAGRWVTGTTMPSAQNLARLTNMVADRMPGFSMLDWERDIEEIESLLRADRPLALAQPQQDGARPLFGPFPDLEAETAATTLRRGRAYEGIFRNTRPFSDVPGKFIHDYALTRAEPEGLLTWSRSAGSISVVSRFIALHSQIFIAGKEVTTGLPVFGIVNGSNGSKVVRYEGILLYAAHDGLHTPYATPFISERIADLTGDRKADEERFAELAQQAGVVSGEAVAPEIRAHLIRDIGPAAFACGGELLLRMAPGQSMAQSYIPG